MPVITWKLPPAADAPALEEVALPPGLGTLDAVSVCLPAGAYTTFRTFRGDWVLELAGHLERLQETARLAGCPLQLASSQVRQALRWVVAVFPGQVAGAQGDLRLRLTLDLEQAPGTLYISAEPLLIPPPEAYTAGVRLVTVPLQRQNPKAKLTGFIAQAGAARQALPEGVHEGLLVDTAGYLLEGLSSNFFAVRDGVLFTAEEGVLDGLTRRLTLACAAELNIPILREPLQRTDLHTIDEAFITSSSRGILPVCAIDAIHLRQACPGEFTSRLARAYAEAVDRRLEKI